MSADDATIDQATAEKIDKAAKLYDALEDADIDLEDLPQQGGTTRRELMQAMGAVGLGSVVGGAAVNEVTGNARAGTNSVGQIGTASSRVDLYSEDADITAATIDSINDNEVNLTRLVENGTYSDIADAIANEPPTNSTGTRHVIEPGSYTVGSGYQLDYSNREIVAYGSAQKWNVTHGTTEYPVEIKQQDGEAEAIFVVPDNATQYYGVTFRGIDFKPVTGGGAHGAFRFGATTSGGLNRDFRFIDCSFRQFGGPGIETDNNTQNYDMSFVRCRFQKVGAQLTLGKQTFLGNCYILSKNPAVDTPMISIADKSQVVGMILSCSSGSDHGLRVRGGCYIHMKNAEGTGTPSGNAAIIVDDSGLGVTSISGLIDNWDHGVRIDSGPINAVGWHMVNIGTYKFNFQGGNNSHNGTYVAGNIAPGTVNFASTVQSQVMIWSSGIITTSGAAPDPFVFILHKDADGATTGDQPALAYGGSSLVPARYWTGTPF